MTLRGAQALPLAASEHYMGTLNTVIVAFDSRRAALSAKLDAAPNASSQARWAQQLEAASSHAAGQMRAAAPGPSEAKANSAVVASLDGFASGYRRMAEGAHNESHGQYNSGSQEVKSASASLRSALRSIAVSG